MTRGRRGERSSKALLGPQGEGRQGLQGDSSEGPPSTPTTAPSRRLRGRQRQHELSEVRRHRQLGRLRGRRQLARDDQRVTCELHEDSRKFVCPRGLLIELSDIFVE